MIGGGGVLAVVHGCSRLRDSGVEDAHELMDGQGGEFGDIETGDRHRQSFGPELLSLADRAGGNSEELSDPPLHPSALRVRKRVEHVFPGTDEGSRIGRFGTCCDRFACLGQGQPGVDGKVRGLLGVEDPVAVLSRQVLPRHVDVVAEGDEHIAQLVAVPGLRPGVDRAFPDRQRRVRDHLLLGHLVDATDSVTFGAGAFDGVRREVLGQQHRLIVGIVAGAGEEHAHEAGHRRDAADARARAASAALLLQSDSRRHPRDRIDVRDPGLVDEPAGVGSDGFEVATLGFGIESAEGQGGLARPGHTGEHDERVSGHCEIDVAQIVFPRAADPHIRLDHM